MACGVRDRQSVIAPAKINLTLRIVGQRTDGYHDLESVAVLVTLYDGIDVSTTDGPAIRIECSDSSVPTDGRNLLWKAAELLSERADHPTPVLIQLHKRIPVGAGLGGGSSDAAAMLKLLNQRWNIGLTRPHLSVLGAGIGSDVPLFLQDSPAVLISGRGETVQRCDVPWSGWLLLVFPPFSVSTAAVYHQWTAAPHHGGADPQACLRKECCADELNNMLFNDLEESICAVEGRMAQFKTDLEARAQRRFHVSGSGSTLFRCLDTHEEAECLKQRLDQFAGIRNQITRVLTEEDN